MNGKKTIIRFIKTSITYFIGNVSTKLIAFLLIPIYTAYLNPSEYGGYDLIISILNLVVPLAFFQIWDGVFRFAFDKKESEHKTYIINNGFVIVFAGICLLVIFDVILKNIYPDYISIWVIIYGICYAMQYFYTVIARINLNNMLFSASGVVNALTAALLNIYMIKYCGMGVDSLYIAASVGIIVQIIMIEVKFRALLHFNIKSIDKKCIREMIRFSFPLCISTIAYWMLNGYSKILISSRLGVHDNGLYAVANKFTSMILIVVSVIQFAWNEMVYIMSNDADKTATYQKGIRFIFTTTMLSGAAFIFVARLIFPYFVDSSYSDAIYLIPISMIGVAMNSFASFSGTLFLANKKSGALLTTTIFAVFANVVLSFFFITKYKLQGVLVALSIALTILTLTRLVALFRQYNIKLSVENAISFIIFIIAVYGYFRFSGSYFDVGSIIVIIALAFILVRKEIYILFRIMKIRR